MIRSFKKIAASQPAEEGKAEKGLRYARNVALLGVGASLLTHKNHGNGVLNRTFRNKKDPKTGKVLVSWRAMRNAAARNAANRNSREDVKTLRRTAIAGGAAVAAEAGRRAVRDNKDK